MSSVAPERPVSPEQTMTPTSGAMDSVGRFGNVHTPLAPLEEEGQGREEISADNGEGTEEEAAVYARDPGDPTEEEKEDHRCSHLPYRSWCRWCVMGRGTGQPHQQREQKGSTSRVGVDYFFIVNGEIKGKDELDKRKHPDGLEKLDAQRKSGHVVKCLLVRCWQRKAVFAHVIPQRGRGEDQYVASLLASDLEWFGYRHLTTRHDNEPALVALVDEAVEILRVRGYAHDSIQKEHPPPKYDSKANGGTEIVLRLVNQTVLGKPHWRENPG